ncbi:MHJ_0274 family protein [Mycoplasma simbae]|uniref:MHJ_0274 family protein n=1 Tax=Mycoplasma simbae TaxID=36744 RepID=UPI000496861F|nr:hypothetical protein [Mycoplasma simbae]
MPSYTMWIIFGAVIAILIAFFIYSAVKDSLNKKKRKQKEIQYRLKSQEVKQELIIKLHHLVAKNEKMLQEFEPSIGEYKMKEIVDSARAYLLAQQQESDFKEYVINNPDGQEIMLSYETLRDKRSTVWKNEAQTLKFIEDEYLLIDQQNQKDLIDKVVKNIEEFYKNELKKS